jgi:hypothetical protein
MYNSGHMWITLFMLFLRWQWSLILQTSKQFIKILGRFSSHSQVLIEICLLTAIKMYFRFSLCRLFRTKSFCDNISWNYSEWKWNQITPRFSFLIYQAEFIINWINFMSKTSLLNNFLFSFCNLILARKKKFEIQFFTFVAFTLHTCMVGRKIYVN